MNSDHFPFSLFRWLRVFDYLLAGLIEVHLISNSKEMYLDRIFRELLNVWDGHDVACDFHYLRGGHLLRERERKEGQEDR